MKRKINYITHDAWWDSDLPLFPQLIPFFRLNVFVYSSIFYDKKYPNKQLPYLDKIYEYENKYRLKNPLSFFSAFSFFRKIYKNIEKNDILFYVFGDDVYFNILMLLFSKKKNTIVSFHNYESHGDGSFYDNIFKRLLIKRFKNFHFNSQIQYTEFRLHNPEKKSFYTNLSLKDFGNPNGKIKINSNGKRVFLFFGYIRAYKRLDLFIKAANKLNDQAHFVIAGSTNNWSAYENLIEDKRNFTCNIKWINDSEISDYFTQSDFLVLPYSDTTQSGPLLIAYNYNLPVIASNLEMFNVMIKDNQNGYLFDVNDVNALSDKLTAACNLTTEQYMKMREQQSFMKEDYKLKTKDNGKIFSDFINNHMI